MHSAELVEETVADGKEEGEALEGRVSVDE